jgi:hypothetical protein
MNYISIRFSRAALKKSDHNYSKRYLKESSLNDVVIDILSQMNKLKIN